MKRALLGLAALWLLGCELWPDQDVRVQLLVDEQRPPDVLVESRRFAAAQPAAGQRLLSGWRFDERAVALLGTPEPGGGRLEIVQVRPRERRLLLALERVEHGGEARLYHGGRLLDRRVFEGAATELELTIPADLPIGRIALDLEISPPVPIWLESTGLRSVAPPGAVDLAADTIEQGGDSIVDFVLPVEPASVLRGRLELARGSTSQQVFELHVEGGDETVRHIYRRRLLEPILGSREIEVPLGSSGGLRRIRLLARGDGPPARWHLLHVESVGLGDWEPVVEPPEAPPLVVLYVLDALRADALGHLGGPEGISPTLDRLAQQGVTFLDHQSVAPNTTASTKSLFTGRYFPLQGEKKLPAEGLATLAELFAEAGYRTGAFSGNGNISEPLGNIRGFEVLERAPVGERGPTRRPYHDDAERVHAAAFEWLDGLPRDEPVFLYLHTVHPHSPYDPPESFRQRWVSQEGSAIEGDRHTLKRLTAAGPEGASPADRERLRQLYLASLAYNDARLAVFLEQLRDRFGDRELLLMLTSDHGEELYEHGGILHGFTLYREMLHIPLIFWWPDRLEPRRVEAVTDSVDLHETLRQLLGLESADPLGEARSLWPLLLGKEVSPRLRFASKSGRDVTYHMADDGRFKLIWAPADGRIPGMGRGGARSFELEHAYDLRTDPGETVNMAGDPRLEIAWLRSRLRGFVERGSRFEVGEAVGEFDEETLGILRALGYVD